MQTKKDLLTEFGREYVMNICSTGDASKGIKKIDLVTVIGANKVFYEVFNKGVKVFQSYIYETAVDKYLSIK